MRRAIAGIFVALCVATTAFAQSINDELQEFSAREYPNDQRMRSYVYNQQLGANRYMASATDREFEAMARRQQPNDYAMQQYIYDRLVNR